MLYEVITDRKVPAFLRGPRTGRSPWRDRTQDRQGGARTPAVPRQRGPRLPDAGPQGGHAVRRRSAANPPGQRNNFV